MTKLADWVALSGVGGNGITCPCLDRAVIACEAVNTRAGITKGCSGAPACATVLTWLAGTLGTSYCVSKQNKNRLMIKVKHNSQRSRANTILRIIEKTILQEIVISYCGKGSETETH